MRYRRRASDAARTRPPRAASSPRAAPPAPLRYDIGDPTDVKQTAGAKLNADGTFNMDNVPEEMKAILADIEAKKAKAAGGGGRVSVQVPAGAPPPPPGAPPPPPGPPPDAGMDEAAAARRAQRTETNAMKHRDSAAMDTMLLINEKDEEISKLQQARDARAIRPMFGALLRPSLTPRPLCPSRRRRARRPTPRSRG